MLRNQLSLLGTGVESTKLHYIIDAEVSTVYIES